MENNCEHLCGHWCKLTTNDLGPDIVMYHCAFPENCRECVDYKRKVRKRGRKIKGGTKCKGGRIP